MSSIKKERVFFALSNNYVHNNHILISFLVNIAVSMLVMLARNWSLDLDNVTITFPWNGGTS